MRRLRGPFLLSIFLLIPGLARAGNLISSMTWTESGDYKMPRQDSVPFHEGAYCTTCTINAIWDGTHINLFGGKGELLTWVTYLEASAAGNASNVMVKLSSFTGTSGDGFSAVVVSSMNVWDYTQRPYSLYKYGYLQQVGMSQVDIGWDPTEYDEQQLPPRWQVPCTVNVNNDCPPTGGTQLWSNRQDHDKFYPDIAVPMEEFSASSFTVSASSSQAIGGEVYISTNLVAGSTYTATLTVYEGASVSTTIPINLYVFNVTLPVSPTMPVIAFVGLSDFATRLTGNGFPSSYFVDPYLTNTLRAGAFLHRHKVLPVGDVVTGGQNYPSPAWSKFMDGSAFKETYGLSANTGPGYAVSDSTMIIGPYGGWVSVSWSTYSTGGSNDFCTNASSWTAWCVNNNKKCYLYTPNDEAPTATLHTEDNAIAQLLSTGTPCAFNNQRILFLQTGSLPTIVSTAPFINTVFSTSWMGVSSATWVADEALYQQSSTHSVGQYNSGVNSDSILNIQEEGLGSREPLWGAWKTGQSMYFLWEINYWTDSNNGGQVQNGWNANSQNQNDMYNLTKDFGYDNYPTTDSVKGHTGFHWTSGDGNMLYYSTDTVYANPSYGVDGVFGSWRLNQLTRGIQDVDIITLANAVNASSTTAIVNQQVQDVAYLRQCFTLGDCSYSYGPRPWSENLNSWEAARKQLLILAASSSPSPPPSSPSSTIFIIGPMSIKGQAILKGR